MWSPTPDIFLIRWRNKIKPSSSPWKAEQDANFACFTTHALLPIFPEESWVLEWIRIRVGYVWTGKFDLKTDTCVDVKIFESGKKKLRIQKYPDIRMDGAYTWYRPPQNWKIIALGGHMWVVILCNKNRESIASFQKLLAVIWGPYLVIGYHAYLYGFLILLRSLLWQWF